MNTSIRLIPRIEVQRRRGGGRGAHDGGHSQLYKDIADGVWPPLIKLGKASLQPEHEVDEMLAAIIAGATLDERRQLVKQLVANRSARLPRTVDAGPAATATAA